MALRRPTYELTWKGKNAKKTLDPYILDLIFLDREEGESDELEFTLDDKKGLWRNEHYPTKGDTLELKIGWVDGVLDPCGTFQIDEVEVYRGYVGDRVKVKGLSAIITSVLRTKQDFRYENITFKRLATTVAARAGMSVTGITDNITIAGISQHEETSLSFLRRVAYMYGYIFSIKSQKIVFTKVENLQARPVVTRIHPGLLNQIVITDATDLTFKAARHTYIDPATGKKIQYEHQGSGSSVKQDIWESEGFVENRQQAELRAKANWLRSQNGSVSGTMDFAFGVSGILAGNNIEIVNMGKVSGVYHINSTRHSVSASTGAQLSADVHKVGEVSPSLF